MGERAALENRQGGMDSRKYNLDAQSCQEGSSHLRNITLTFSNLRVEIWRVSSIL